MLGGTLAGMLAFGGGAVIPPLLGLLLGVPQHVAQAISLGALLPPVGLPALVAYRKAGVRPDLRVALWLIGGFVAAAPAGAWLANAISAPALRWSFAAFLVVLGVQALRRKAATDDDAPSGRLSSVAALAIGAAAGAFSGLLGIGGGIIALVLLRASKRLPRLQAQATGLLMMLPPVGLPALVVYARERGGLPWPAVAAVAVGFTIGAAIGGRLAVRVSGPAATRVYAIALFVLAAVTAVH